ncbi:cyclin-dependent kinase inhibitor 1 [Alligator sinensis]|uniref:Cyclin-dependent kinase inhibitor 1 n=1 Tax=Alligator sinensis TaxID=38654 RepID=A0A3Q0GPW1_ALLSI|nr:cyclin-dependent kinase inhibitor 1 [Alligator sinensis]
MANCLFDCSDLVFCKIFWQRAPQVHCVVIKKVWLSPAPCQWKTSPAGNMPLSQSNLRQTPCSRKSCRNLFGPVDHEQLQSDFQDSMRKNLEEAQFKWNFDFETETPLEGAFKWERVPFPDMSSEYLCSHSKVSGENSRSTSTLKIPTKDLLNRPFSGETIQQVSEANRASSPRRLKRRQTTIKDFYSAKRKISSSKPNP